MRVIKCTCFLLFLVGSSHFLIAQQLRYTNVQIVENQFYINGEPTYVNREWQGHKIEGLLMNSRMVQGIFDDLNPNTTHYWKYFDTGVWDPERNTKEFVANMQAWKDHGLLSFTINLQGGSPFGYSQTQAWHNSAFDSKGNLRQDYMKRLQLVLDKADELGMVPIVGLFYFGQDERLENEQAVIQAVNNAVDWILDKGYKNILLEINNECDIQYDHPILECDRVHELIAVVKGKTRAGYKLHVSTSYSGGTIPKPNVVEVADFLLLHGNGVSEPDRIVQMVKDTRNQDGYRNVPIVFNEDDHFNFDQEWNNFKAAVSSYASWGYFDYRKEGESFSDGFQSIPVDWGINSNRKRGFFDLVKEITSDN